MNSYIAFQIYIALKAHFSTSSYDFFKFHGRVSIKKDTLEYRNDKYFFKKILEYYPTKDRLIGFYVSNILKNYDFWIGDFQNKVLKKNYQEWLGKLESLSYGFIQDLRKVKTLSEESGIPFRDFFKIDTGKSESRFLEMVLDEVVTLETYVIVDKVIGLNKYYDGKINDPLYEDFALKVKKYSPFIQIDGEEFSHKFKEFL